MPEGPSILILKEAVAAFKGRKVTDAAGYAKGIDYDRFAGEQVVDFKSWGKHFLICFHGVTVRIHFGLFGSYRINERAKVNAKFSLQFAEGELNFYVCQVKVIEGDLDAVYDWSADIMNTHWSPAKALKKLKAKPAMLLCDALLDQNIFSGSGNIIKNEALFRAKLHPENTVEHVPEARLKALIRETSRYSFDFLHWRQEGVLNKHLEAYKQETCPRDNHAITRKDTGKGRRTSYFCPHCQKLYRAAAAG